MFATNRIAGCCNKIVMEPVQPSQHRPIGVQVNAAIHFRRRFNQKKANWEQYTYQLDAAVENIPGTAECYVQFVNALSKVARNNNLRGCRRNYVPGLTPESIEEIEEYREKYEDDPFEDNTANQVAYQLLLNGRVSNRQPKERLDRQRYPDDPGFTRAFTIAELDIGIRVLKNGKAPGLDDINTELVKQFGSKAREWLLRFSITVPRLRKFRSYDDRLR